MPHASWFRKLRRQFLGGIKTTPIRRAQELGKECGFDRLEDRIVPDATIEFGALKLVAVGSDAKFDTTTEYGFNVAPQPLTSIAVDRLQVISTISRVEVFINGGTGNQTPLFILPSGGRFRRNESYFSSLTYADVVPRYGLLSVPNGLNANSTIGQQQSFSYSASAGCFTLNYGGQTTANLPLTATGEDVQKALNGLSTIGSVGGNVEVTKAFSSLLSGFTTAGFNVTFGGTLYSQPSRIGLNTTNSFATLVKSTAPFTTAVLTKQDSSLAATSSDGFNTFAIPLVYYETSNYGGVETKIFEPFRGKAGVTYDQKVYFSELTIPADRASTFPIVESPAFTASSIKYVPSKPYSGYQQTYDKDTIWTAGLEGTMEFPQSFVGAVKVRGDSFIQPTNKGLSLVFSTGYNANLPVVSAGLDANGQPRPVTFPFGGLNFVVPRDERISVKYDAANRTLVSTFAFDNSGRPQLDFLAIAHFDGGNIANTFGNLSINLNTGNATIDVQRMAMLNMGGLQFSEGFNSLSMSYDKTLKRFTISPSNISVGFDYSFVVDVNAIGDFSLLNNVPARLDPVKVNLGLGNFTITNGVLDAISGLAVKSFQIGRANETRTTSANNTKYQTYTSVGSGNTLFMSFIKSTVFDAANNVLYPGDSWRIYGQANTSFSVANVTMPKTIDLGTATLPTGNVRPGLVITNGELQQFSFPVANLTAANLTFTNSLPGFLGYLTATYVRPLSDREAPYYQLSGRANLKAVGALSADQLVNFGSSGGKGFQLFPTQSRFTMDFGVTGALQAGNNSLTTLRDAGWLLATYNPTTKQTTLSGKANVTMGNGNQVTLTATIPANVTITGNNSIAGNWTLFYDKPLVYNGFALVPQDTNSPLRLELSNTTTNLRGDFSLNLEGQDLYGSVRPVVLARGNLPASGLTLDWKTVGSAAPPWALGGVLLSGMQPGTLTDTLRIAFTNSSFEGVNLASGLVGNEPNVLTATNGRGVSAVIAGRAAQQVGDVFFSNFTAVYNFATTPRRWEFTGNGTAFGNAIKAQSTANGTGNGALYVSIGGDAIRGYQLSVGGVPAAPTNASFDLPDRISFNGVEVELTGFKTLFNKVSNVSSATFTLNSILSKTINIGRTAMSFEISKFSITVTAAGASVTAFEATLTQNKAFVIGNASFKVKSLTVGYSTPSDPLVSDDLKGAFRIYGTATFSYTGAGTQVDMEVTLGDLTKPGLVIKNGAVQSLKVGVSGSFSIMKLTATVDPAEALTLEYKKATQEYVLYGAVKLSTASQSGIQVLKDLKVTLGTADAPGIVIASGNVETIDISITGDINIFSLTASPQDLRLKYSAADNQLSLTGKVEVTLATGLVLKAGLPGDGLVIDTNTGKVKIKGISLESEGDIKFGTAFTIKNLHVDYADDGTKVTIAAGANLVMPSGLEVGGAFLIRNGKLSSITITFARNPGMIVAGGIVNIYSISGTVSNLDDLTNFTISAEVKATVGPAVIFAGQTYALVDVAGRITVNKDSLKLSGNANLVGGLFGTATMDATLNWGANPAHATFDGTVKLYPGDILQGKITAFIDVTGNFNFNARIGAYVPTKIPVVGGKALGELTIDLRVRPHGAPSESYAAFDISLLNVGGGVRASFDASVEYNLRADFGLFKIRKAGSFSLRDAIDLPTVQILNAVPITGTPNANITISSSTTLPNSTTIELYADPDGSGHNGVLIASVPYQSGTQTVTWHDMAAFAPPGQPVFVYAVINDLSHPKGYSDYSASLTTETGFLPGVSVPGPQSFHAEGGIRFDTAGFNAITVSDARLASEPHSLTQVTLDVGKGTLELPETFADVMSFGDGTSRIVLIGIATEITKAIEGLIYHPAASTSLNQELSVSAAFLPLYNPAGTVTQTIPLKIQPMSISLAGSSYTGAPPTEIARGTVGETPLENVLLGDTPEGILPGVQIIVAGYVQGKDTLGFTINDEIATGLQSNFDPSQGVLTLTGFATAEQYAIALRRVTFFTTDTASTKTLILAAADGGSEHATFDLDLSIVDAIEPPRVSVSPNGINYVQGSGTVNVATSAAITIPASASVTRMTVSIFDGFVSGEDVLAYTGGVLSASYDTSNGVLTLTGTGTAADYETALKQVTYTNTNATVTVGLRQLQIKVVDSIGIGMESGTTQPIAVTTTPTTFTGVTLTLSNSTTTLPVNSTTVALDPALTLTSDVPSLTEATVAITAGYIYGVDELIMSDLPFNMSASFNPATATLKITGSATVTEYQNVLRGVLLGVRARDRSTATPRTVEFTASARLGTPGSASLTVDIATAPFVNIGIDGLVKATHGRTEIDIAPGIFATASANITGATVAITGGYRQGEDELHFTDQNGITGSFDANTGILTLTGSATALNYSVALASVKFFNSRFNPSVGDRIVSFQVQVGTALSNIAKVNVRVRPEVVGPTLSMGAGSTFTENGVAVAVAPSLTLAAKDATTTFLSAPDVLYGAVVDITNFIASEDVLEFTDQNGITGEWDAANGRLILTGTASLADYQAALRSVTYTNTSDAPISTARTIAIRLLDNLAAGFSNGGTTTVDIQSVDDLPTQTGTPTSLSTLLNSVAKSLGLGTLSFAHAATVLNTLGSNLVFQPTTLPSETLGTIIQSDGSALVVGNTYSIAALAGLHFAPGQGLAGSGNFAFNVFTADATTGNLDTSSLPVTLSITVAGATTNTASEAYVAQLSRDVLGTNPTASFITTQAAALDTARQQVTTSGGVFTEAAARRSVALPLVTSSEGRTAIVHSVYRSLLGRDASTTEITEALSALSNGSTLMQLRARLAGFGEYFAQHFASGFTSFVNAIYDDLLGREPSTSERNTWVNALVAGTETTFTVATKISNTSEAFNHTFATIIESLLRREYESQDALTFTSSATPQGELELIAAVLASDEYFARYNTPSTSSRIPVQPTNSFPFVGEVGDASGPKAGGTLIAPSFVLVAGHSVVGLPPGQLSFTIGGTTYQVKKVHIHPDYTPEFLGTDNANDLAILELTQPVSGITPAKLLDGPPQVGDVLNLVGFGARNGTEYGTKRLGSTPSVDVVTESRIVWTFNNPGDTNTTQGDSGSPLLLDKSGTPYVAAVVSGGTDPSSGFGDVATSTRVDTSLPWIQSIVGPLTNDSDPAVASIIRQIPSYAATNRANVTFTVTFGESVQNVDTPAFLSSLGNVSDVTPLSNQAFNITVDGLAGTEGLVSLGLKGSNDITDFFSNLLANTTPTGANETFNLDHIAPTSAVAALPSTSGSNIMVHWAGQDNANGSGIASYDIFISTDGGPFVAWKVGTIATNDTYSAARGHTYAFFSVATDAAGNREGNATNADATTIVPANQQPPSTDFAVAPFRGSSLVTVFNQNGSPKFTYNPFPNFNGGVRTVMADFTGDGIADLVVGTGPGTLTEVRVIDGATRAEIFRVNPFENRFTGGVFVAAGDITGDGRAELVITPDLGGGPRVRIFSGASFTVIADFYAIDDHNFRGGARATVGDLNNDGYGDLVVSAGIGGGPRVAAFNGKTMQMGGGPKLFNDFYMFEPALNNGSFVAVGDVDGDGYADIAGGAGPGGSPRVVVASGKSLLDGAGDQFTRIADFTMGGDKPREGVNVAIKDLDGDGYADLLAGNRQLSLVSAYKGSALAAHRTDPLFSLDEFDFNGGVYVG